MAPLKSLTSLTTLWLRNNQITDLTNLQTLHGYIYKFTQGSLINRIIFYILFKMPAFQNRLVGDIESFSKGLKKAGRAFKKGGIV
eukprot:SAG22_NODE_5866_length_939_cov_1.414286_2_plen_85_part_00